MECSWLPTLPACGPFFLPVQAGLVPQVPADLQIRSGEPFSLTSFALSLLLVFR
jgi:hypothetical protein